MLVRLYLQLGRVGPNAGTLNVEQKGDSVEISGTVFFADKVDTVRRRVEVETGTKTWLKYADPETLISRLLKILPLVGFEVTHAVSHNSAWKKKDHQIYLSDYYVGTIRYDSK